MERAREFLRQRPPTMRLPAFGSPLSRCEQFEALHRVAGRVSKPHRAARFARTPQFGNPNAGYDNLSLGANLVFSFQASDGQATNRSPAEQIALRVKGRGYHR